MSYYTLLHLPPPPAPFSAAACKRAYHRALLRHHPDKSGHGNTTTPRNTVDIDTITTAYKTLSSGMLRAEYNRSLLERTRANAEEGERAGVVVVWDLDEMEEGEVDGEGKGEGEEKCGVWRKKCRCGEMVLVHEDALEEGGETGEAWAVCEGCSIVYCVAFEVVVEG
ncbi:hypothetical protein EX30DRAFT_373425 [Ascodesmis nigricans]|uniref:Diphthamide biosynthesis protein 4 n=1 Tax=Ascodesmis nigricans TaxID=341454 RepID=A0A4S2MP22_9PEZI|nr:hypothetical protein EX30DRAFT_373425 [Ascodesmis nigricans]